MDALTGLFDKVGLRTNANKTMGMVCNTCKTARRKLEEPYTRMMTGVGTSFQEQQRKRVSLPECTVVLASGLLAAQCQYQHGMSKSPKWDPPPPNTPGYTGYPSLGWTGMWSFQWWDVGGGRRRAPTYGFN